MKDFPEDLAEDSFVDSENQGIHIYINIENGYKHIDTYLVHIMPNARGVVL